MLDYGALAAGVAIRKSFTITGDADHESDTVWYVDTAEISRKCPGLSLNPERGALSMGAANQIVATMRSERAQTIDTFFQIMVRGGKPIKMKVKTHVVVPDAKVLNDEFDFGSTYLGATSVRPLKICNASEVDAIFTLDLKKHFEFGFRLPEELEFEDDEAPSQEKRHSLAGLKHKAHDTETKDVADDPNEVSEGRLTKFRVPANSEVAIDMTFSPVALMNHAFELPLSMQGLPANAMRPLRRAVCAESSRPRLLLSMSALDFGTNIVVNENMGSFAYHMTLTVTNCDESPCVMDAALRGPMAKAGIFVMAPVTASLVVGHACSMQIDFIPRKPEDYKCQLAISIDGQTDAPYFELDVSGLGVYPSIQFDRREILMAPAPPGHTQKVSFFVINQGFDNLNLRYAMAAGCNHLPLKVTFPLGTMLNVVKQRILVEVTVTCEENMSFTGTIEFYDNQDQVYSIEVSATQDASLLSIFSWLSLHKGYYDIQAKPGKALSLTVNSELMDHDFDANGVMSIIPPGSPIQGSPNHSKPALQPNAVFLCACASITEKKSVDFLLHYCNMAVLKQAISKFPADIHEQRGKMIFDVVEQSTGKIIPGQIKKIAASRKEEAQQTLNYYREVCNSLKLYGALISLVRPEYMLPFHLFEKLYLDGKLAEAASYSTETLEFLENHFQLVHEASWLIILYQVLKYDKYVKSDANIYETETSVQI